MIRPAIEKDIKAIAAIYEEIHTEEETGRLSVGWQRGVYPTEETAAASVAKGSMFVCERDGHVVAAAKIDQDQVDVYYDADWEFPAEDDEVMVMHTLVVSPSAMSKGVAKEFLEFYEEYARQNNCPYLRIDTNEKNQRARALYSRMKYKERGTALCIFNGLKNVKLVLLEKKIDI